MNLFLCLQRDCLNAPMALPIPYHLNLSLALALAHHHFPTKPEIAQDEI